MQSEFRQVQNRRLGQFRQREQNTRVNARRNLTARKKTIEEFESYIFEKFMAKIELSDTPFDIFCESCLHRDDQTLEGGDNLLEKLEALSKMLNHLSWLATKGAK